MTELKNMLIHHAVFHYELFQWFIFLTKCEILNFVDVICTGTVPLSVEQLDTAGYVIFLFKSFISSIFNSLSIVQKHVAQICSSITLAD